MNAKTKTSTEAVETVLEAGKARVEQVVKASTETATKNFEKVMEVSKTQMDEAFKAFNELSSFSKANMEAAVASSQAAAKGLEELTKVATEYSKKSFSDVTENMKSLSGAKTVKDFIDLNNTTLKSQYDAFVSESSKMTELAMKVMSDVMEPLSTRMAVTFDKAAKAAK